VEMARIVLTVAPRTRVLTDQNVHHCPMNKNASGPLTLNDLLESFQGRNVKIAYSLCEIIM